MDRQPLVSIIIVNWNGKHLLRECLDAVFGLTYNKFEVVFVDNASEDGSVEFIKTNFPKVKIYVNEKNLGVGGGFEVGLQKVRGEAVLLLNTDAIVSKKLLNSLITVLYSDFAIGAVQPKLVLYPGKKLIDSIGCFFLPNGDLYHIGREKDHSLPIYNKQMEIFSTKGACMIIKTKILKKVGLFDKDFFAYFEDTDLCMRILIAGYKILYDPSETVYHRGGATSKNIMHANILFHSYKNRIYAYLKNFSFLYILRVLPLMIFMYQIAFLGYIITGRFQYALALQKGILWNIVHMDQILKKRRFIQERIRKVSDDEYMPQLTKNVSPMYYWYQFFGGIEKYKDQL